MFTIRTIKTEDAQAICKIQQETWIATYQSIEEFISKTDLEEYTSNWTTPDNIKLLKTWIKKPNQKWLVAELDGRVVGHIRFLIKNNHGEIDMFYILPSYQGLGIGKKLLESVTKKHRSDIIVDVVDFNQNAICFYLKNNFTFVGKEENNARPLPSGKKMGLIRMKKLAT